MDRATALEQIRSLLLKGAPWDASDAFREAVAHHGDDAELLYWGALAHARSGATREARSLLERIGQARSVTPAIRRESLCLSGRLWKDRIDPRRTPGANGPDEAIVHARADYLAAYAIDHDCYPGTNAATLSMLLGERAMALELARTLVAQLADRTDTLTPWEEATLGEACLLLGDLDAARTHYTRAHASAPDALGNIASMRRQLALLAAVLPEASTLLDAVPQAPVLLFAGHMIDRPGAKRIRFPAALEPFVAEALAAALAHRQRPVVYTSAACGGDLLFIEAALAVDAELNIVLPFDRDDFVEASVAIAGSAWVDRFDRALARATRIVYATEERYLGDDVLFEHAQYLVEGLAALRAAQLQTSPKMLCLLDEDAASGVGGTRDAHQRWTQRRGPPEVIELGAMRRRFASVLAAAPSSDASTPALTEAPFADRPRRTLKVMLFADVAGFGRVHDAHAPLFHARFLSMVAGQLERCPRPPLEMNTWGDALYVVFDAAEDGVEFALGLVERMDAVDWLAAGLPASSQIRVALHAGPVFCGYDPIIGRDNYFGTSVVKTARIEPITPPGVVYASESFVATLASSDLSRHACEYVGELQLAKNHGPSRIYRLERIGAKPADPGLA